MSGRYSCTAWIDLIACRHDGTVRVVGTESRYGKMVGGSFCSLFRASTAGQVVPRARTSIRAIGLDGIASDCDGKAAEKAELDKRRSGARRLEVRGRNMANGADSYRNRTTRRSKAY
ncbi:hypothetical protein EJB05_17531, partial [Eragrostis curvula]